MSFSQFIQLIIRYISMFLQDIDYILRNSYLFQLFFGIFLIFLIVKVIKSLSNTRV